MGLHKPSFFFFFFLHAKLHDAKWHKSILYIVRKKNCGRFEETRNHPHHTYHTQPRAYRHTAAARSGVGGHTAPQTVARAAFFHAGSLSFLAGLIIVFRQKQIKSPGTHPPTSVRCQTFYYYSLVQICIHTQGVCVFYIIICVVVVQKNSCIYGRSERVPFFPFFGGGTIIASFLLVGRYSCTSLSGGRFRKKIRRNNTLIRGFFVRRLHYNLVYLFRNSAFICGRWEEGKRTL